MNHTCSVASPPAVHSSLVAATRALRTPTIRRPEGLAAEILARITLVKSLLTSARRAFSAARILAALAASLTAFSWSWWMASSRGASRRDDRRSSRAYAGLDGWMEPVGESVTVRVGASCQESEHVVVVTAGGRYGTLGSAHSQETKKLGGEDTAVTFAKEARGSLFIGGEVFDKKPPP